jgi:hypothetical protein
METGGIAIEIGSNPIQEGWTPIITTTGGRIMPQRFGSFKNRVIPKEEWEWSDWRTWEIDMAYVVWKHTRAGRGITKIHYGD